MKKSGKMRLLSIVLSVAVAVSMMPIMAITASANSETCEIYLKVTPTVASDSGKLAKAVKKAFGENFNYVDYHDHCYAVALKLDSDYAKPYVNKVKTDFSFFTIEKKGSKYAIRRGYFNDNGVWTKCATGSYLKCDADGDLAYSDSAAYVWKHNGGFYAYTTETGRIFKKKHYLDLVDEKGELTTTTTKKVAASVECYVYSKNGGHKLDYKYVGKGQHTEKCVICGYEYPNPKDCDCSEGTSCSLCKHYKTAKNDVKVYGTVTPIMIGKEKSNYKVRLAAQVANDSVESVICMIDDTEHQGRTFTISDLEYEKIAKGSMTVTVKTDSNQEGLTYKMKLSGLFNILWDKDNEQI